MKKHDVYQQILDVAENLTQTKGYHAFSYKDISAQVGVKTSSIHYYFPTKADLGKAVMQQHAKLLCDELEQLMSDKILSCQEKLAYFIDGIVAKTYLADRKMCLGGMLAVDVLILPDMIQDEVRLFFHRLETWMKRLLREGITKKEFLLQEKDVHQETFIIFSLIEGALLLARLFQDEGHLAAVKRHLLSRYQKD